jgi:hypothetical protein
VKKSFGGVLAALAGAYVFMSPITAQNVGDIFVPEDTDAFDPGLPIGARFPQIRALYQGREITDIDQFMGEKGAVFFANRSVDW